MLKYHLMAKGDATKIVGETGNVEEAGRLQKNVDKQGEWTKKWQMEYNVGKCETMHFDRKNSLLFKHILPKTRVHKYPNGNQLQEDHRTKTERTANAVNREQKQKLLEKLS
eukprot:g38054.t1